MRCKPPIKKPTNHSGKRFGRLVAISYEPAITKVGNRSRWRCLCDCGKEKVIQTAHLVNGKIKSCGCINIERIITRNRALLNPETHTKTWYNSTKKRAKGRGIGFDLSIEDYYKLVIQSCYYCGRPPGNSTKKSLGGYRPFSGIDRIDSSGDYEISNCRPCCKNCNYAKAQLTETEFRTLIRDIYEYWVKDNTS